MKAPLNGLRSASRVTGKWQRLWIRCWYDSWFHEITFDKVAFAHDIGRDCERRSSSFKLCSFWWLVTRSPVWASTLEDLDTLREGQDRAEQSQDQEQMLHVWHLDCLWFWWQNNCVVLAPTVRIPRTCGCVASKWKTSFDRELGTFKIWNIFQHLIRFSFVCWVSLDGKYPAG